jgi:hypothetical protein
MDYENEKPPSDGEVFYYFAGNVIFKDVVRYAGYSKDGIVETWLVNGYTWGYDAFATEEDAKTGMKQHFENEIAIHESEANDYREYLQQIEKGIQIIDHTKSRR